MPHYLMNSARGKAVSVAAYLVYRYLLSSFCNACLAWKGGKGATIVYMDDCVYVFRMWFCDRFVPSNTRVHKYPRILHWMTVTVGDKFIKVAMETGVMLDEYGTSRKEMEVSSLQASVDQKQNDAEEEYDAALDEVLHDQDVVIKELEQELVSLKAELVEEINNDEGGNSTCYEEQFFYNDFASEGRNDRHDSDKNKKDNVDGVSRAKPIELHTPDTVQILVEILYQNLRAANRALLSGSQGADAMVNDYKGPVMAYQVANKYGQTSFTTAFSPHYTCLQPPNHWKRTRLKEVGVSWYSKRLQRPFNRLPGSDSMVSDYRGPVIAYQAANSTWVSSSQYTLNLLATPQSMENKKVEASRGLMCLSELLTGMVKDVYQCIQSALHLLATPQSMENNKVEASRGAMVW
ncbi:hypothetical protein V8G54_006064 [Vigna mungo]|uniref:Uncharacterized protein n=1 Tax=Vigna mungo TaxID=3915 RepID=A0AAQ3P1I7_VIGMU